MPGMAVVLALATATQAVVAAAAEGFTVTTLAGGGGGTSCAVAGYKDGPATEALFNLPARLQTVSEPDGGERLYIFDIHNGCVRSLPVGPLSSSTAPREVRSDTVCGEASTLAHVGPDARWPNGTSRGFRWIDGPLSFKVARDGSKIWAMDTYNNQLKVARRVTPTPTLATPTAGVAPDNKSAFGPWVVVAGSGGAGTADGAAAEATFYQPHGMDVSEAAGVAFVADTFSSCIRSVDLATGVVTTIAGTCGQAGHRDAPEHGPLSPHDARFNHVHKVTVDPRNESVVYVSEVECSDDGPIGLPDRCRPTVAGQYFAGVRKLELNRDGAVASVTTVAGVGVGYRDGPVDTAQFHYVHDVAIRPLFGAGAGGTTELYVMDDNNNRVRRINLTSGTVTTLAGSGGAGCADGPAAVATFANNGAVGLAVGRDNTVYIADYGNHRIRTITWGSAPPPPTPPIGTTGNGTCGVSTYTGGDCDTHATGWFPNMPSLDACVAKLKPCAMATYATWSSTDESCQWFDTCDFGHLCADCSRGAPASSCPVNNTAHGICPHYYSFVTEVLKTQ